MKPVLTDSDLVQRYATALAAICGLALLKTDGEDDYGTIYTVAHRALGTCRACQDLAGSVKPLAEMLKDFNMVDVDKLVADSKLRWEMGIFPNHCGDLAKRLTEKADP